jgi:hypothetical protein
MSREATPSGGGIVFVEADDLYLAGLTGGRTALRIAVMRGSSGILVVCASGCSVFCLQNVGIYM